ncbi:unnamed protein product [Parascedosporium putredinis]|uniref:CFEM domain-containing protein n=1 Tax=Parascedosporium putredinis TaxID=1442378 RepID=A0A9P1GWQ1_9PEZI|nr:unnamed protein product [Parascedosporium putredinis]CAI7989040.1 unnamed protein product [Parascedosporium putredinis]
MYEVLHRSIECLKESVAAASDCDFEDAWCVCVQATYEAITGHATPCVMTKCGADKAIIEVLPAAIPFCADASASHDASEGSAPKTDDSNSSATAAPTADTTDAPTGDSTSPGAAPAATETGSSGSGSGGDSGAVGQSAPAILGMLLLGAVAAF